MVFAERICNVCMQKTSVVLINKTLKAFKTEIKVLSVLRVLFIKNKTFKTFKTEIKVLSVLQVLFSQRRKVVNFVCVVFKGYYHTKRADNKACRSVVRPL